MPIEIEQDGKKVTVYTEDEAKKLADSAAAKARREAEGKLAELQQELAKSGQSAEKVAALEKQIAEQAGKLTTAERTLKGMKVLAGAGLAPAVAEQLLHLPALAEVNFDEEAGRKQAVDGLKGMFPQLFEQEAQQRQSFAPLGGVGGSPSPGAGALDNEALGKLSMEEYLAARGQRKG